jgi:putative hydrolase of the HAD superfamily
LYPKRPQELILMTAIQAVLFDAVGTMIRVESGVAATYRAAGLRYGANIEESVIRQRFDEAMRRENERDERELAFRTSEEREFERWKAIVEHVFDQRQRRDEIFADLWQVFARPDTWQLYDDVAQVLLALAGRGLVLGVASNFDCRLRSVMAGLPPLANIEHCFVSSELGYRKPAREFFQAVQAALDLPPQAILFVGDDHENDFLAAQDNGWQALLIDRSGKRREKGVVATLADVQRISD